MGMCSENKKIEFELLTENDIYRHDFKAATIDVRYFARARISRRLVHQKIYSLM